MVKPIDIHPEVLKVFDTYPQSARVEILNVRRCIFDVGQTLGLVVAETLKWGEPSYRVAGGSTLRMAWKSASPHNYCLFFNCNSCLVETFREIYGHVFTFEGNRALVLNLNQEPPIKELKNCILMCFRYHKIKHLPLLGYSGAP